MIAISSVKEMPYEDINLSDNRLEGKQIEELIDEISLNTKSIDLSRNKLGKFSTQLFSHIALKNSLLQKLNLEKTSLGDASAISILSYVQVSKHIQSVNLSDNSLSDAIVGPLQDAIDNHSCLNELYLRWNNFSGNFGISFFNYFIQPDKISKFNLRVLDLGCNHLGKGLKVDPAAPVSRRGQTLLEMSKALGKFLETNQLLVHLDLSSNKFRIEECQDIALGLRSNHTIFGMHFDGNFGYIDSEGFLIVEDAIKDPSGPHVARRIDSVNIHSNYKKFRSQIDETVAKNCCWICDGWVEMKFVYTKGK